MAMAEPLSDSIPPSTVPRQLSFPLPRTRNTTVHMHMTLSNHSLLLFLTSQTPEASSQKAALGSFVYALPDRTSTTSPPLSTPLYIREQTLENATRIAKILAKRLAIPVYVGNSMNFSGAGGGGMVEEEMEGVRKVIDVVMNEARKIREEWAKVKVNGAGSTE
ncbi:hypothetical protein Q9L58_000723 [Maublancomyces gigas]|uniref:Uncharacterized protein n=1 Tax=Discina gigas TaxID=1032678 RepID=A0ABR3GWK1_9PEZI